MAMPKRTRTCLLIAAGIAILVSWFVLLPLYSAFQDFREQNRHWRKQAPIYAEILTDIRSRVAVGADREKVLQAMVDSGAWYSVKCAEFENEIIHDIFYFGPRNREDVFVFTTTSLYVDGHYVLNSIAHHTDSVHDLPQERCLPAELK